MKYRVDFIALLIAVVAHIVAFGAIMSTDGVEKHPELSNKVRTKVRLVKKNRSNSKQPEIIKKSFTVNKSKKLIATKPESSKIKKKQIAKEKQVNVFEKNELIKKVQQSSKKYIPRKFTVSMNAVVSTSPVAVPTSSGDTWAYGTKQGRLTGIKTNKRLQEIVSLTQVSRTPKLLKAPSDKEMQKLYPVDARVKGVEANVSMKLLVATSGKVIDVKITNGAGKEFDQAAKQLAKQFLFKAARYQGKPVTVWIPWTYKFRLLG